MLLRFFVDGEWRAEILDNGNQFVGFGAGVEIANLHGFLKSSGCISAGNIELIQR
jgi:hypothetical protein